MCCLAAWLPMLPNARIQIPTLNSRAQPLTRSIKHTHTRARAHTHTRAHACCTPLIDRQVPRVVEPPFQALRYGANK